MSEITKAFTDRMKNDATLQGLLGTYRSEPNVFSANPIPPDASRPYIYVGAIVADTPEASKTTDRRAHMRDIDIVCDATGDARVVETIAERVRTLFHRKPLTINGLTNYIARATGPAMLTTDPILYGRRVTVTLSLTAPLT